MTINGAAIGKLTVGAGALIASTAGSYHLVKKGYIYGLELPKSEVVARTDEVLVERQRPNYKSVVYLGAALIGMGLFIAGSFKGTPPAVPMPGALPGAWKAASAAAMWGAGLGVITGAVGASSLFQGATVRNFRTVEEGGALPLPPGSQAPASSPAPGATTPPATGTTVATPTPRIP